MVNLIGSVLFILVLTLPPYLGFRLVLAGRAVRAWLLPFAVAGMGLGAIHWLNGIAVAEQSRFFGSLVFLALFGLASVLTVLGCLAGHAARWIEARMRGGRQA